MIDRDKLLAGLIRALMSGPVLLSGYPSSYYVTKVRDWNHTLWVNLEDDRGFHQLGLSLSAFLQDAVPVE